MSSASDRYNATIYQDYIYQDYIVAHALARTALFEALRARSREEITLRLKCVSQIRRLCLALEMATVVPATPVRKLMADAKP